MKIFVIGLGNMGEAIVRRLASLKSVYDIYAADKNISKLQKSEREYGTKSDSSYTDLDNADFIILAVKPQDFESLATEIKDRISKNAILLSIAAGVSISKIQKLFGHDKIVRAMPNIGLRVEQGITVWKSANLGAEDTENAKKLLSDISGNFEAKSEDLLDAVTAISGSGPAYFFYLAQALEKSAVNLGISAEEASQLVRKTLSAAAALQDDKSYDELIKEVASKGGTTEAALKTLEAQGFALAVEKAVRAAEARAKEIS